MTEGEFAPFIEGLIMAKEHDEKTLKPCPFCGGKAEFREMMGVECEYITIHCTKCGMCCTKYETWGAVDMVEDWNKRVKE